MKRIFVDANVFVVFFTGDDVAQHASARKMFENARSGKLTLVVGPPVLFEVAWTLRKIYKVPNEAILNHLEGIVQLPGLEVLDAASVSRALDLAQECGAAFADAYIAASAGQSANALATFNEEDFRNLPIERLKL